MLETIVISSTLLICLGALIGTHSVRTDVTEEDRQYLSLLMPDIKLTKPDSYEEEIKLVKEVQSAIIDYAIRKKIKNRLNKTIEPKELYYLKHGVCHDRSRTIEKALTQAGFQVRHISMYDTEGRSPIQALLTPESLTPGVFSHAISEVKTSKGWLVVDPNFKWISVDKNNEPVSIKDIHKKLEELNVPLPYKIYKSFVPVIGLYSRHGRFFPPYNPIPDLNYSQFIANFIDV